jgi:hypothetical protein
MVRMLTVEQFARVDLQPRSIER